MGERQAGIIDVIVIGAGHSGLAMSRVLSERSIEHVVLDRGQVAHSWRSERWDSLRLLTPNWLTRLPGHAYQGDDPDGYMTVAELVEFLRNYAQSSSAPVVSDTTVTRVTHEGAGYRVATPRGDLSLPRAGARDRRLQPAAGTAHRSRLTARGRATPRTHLPQSGATRAGPRAGRRWLRHGRTTRTRNPK